MSSYPTHRGSAQEGQLAENTNPDLMQGTDLEALLRDVRSALRAPAIRHFHKRYERDKAALTRRIDAYLDRSGPTPFGKALATLARQFDGAG